MSGNRKSLGFPSNQTKGNDLYYNSGCGGGAGGACVLPAAFSYLYWPIKVNPFSVQNTKLVIHNTSFIPFTDSAVGLCAHNEGVATQYDVLLFAEEPSGPLDRSKAKSIVTIPTSLTPPFDIEYITSQIPQPLDTGYNRRIWAVLDFGTTGRMIGGLPQVYEMFKTLKINYEGQP